jgi:hypothetical protein
VASPAATIYSGPDPCRHATKGSSPIVKACSEGGTRTAKAFMKDLVSRGKQAGIKLACDDCHKDDTDFSRLLPDAHHKLDELLAAVARK